MPLYPLYVVRRDAGVERLGSYDSERKELVLELPGYPLLGPGTHRVLGDLPWLFWDMCPSGFMARMFREKFPELGLSADDRLWSPADCLTVLSRRGHDLTGNVIVGDESLSLHRQPRAASIEGSLEEPPHGGSSSSLGGERPKYVVRQSDGSEHLMKYSPPIDTPAGRRWADLLAVESMCSVTLRRNGIPAAASDYILPAFPPHMTRRAFLNVLRFDRHVDGGRSGAATLRWLAADRGEAELEAPQVLAHLAVEGSIDADSVRRAELAHAFSLAIGNTDAHLGNYGLVFDDEGRASLAPLYDVLPMALAPRFDELPDARLLARTTRVDPRVEAWVDELVQLVTASRDVSDPFKKLWLGYLSR